MFQLVETKYKVDKDLLEKVAKATFSWLKEDFEVNLAIVSAEEVQKLNLKYRDKDSSTDVLSFKLEDDNSGGDVVIAYEVAEGQARIANMPLTHELAFLLVHGMLHLAGFDHEAFGEQKVMEATENAILSKLDILIER